MIERILSKDSILMSSIKNLFQFLIGVVLFYLVFDTLNLITTIVGAVAFLSIYSAVYPFNDLMDLEKDKKDGKKFKALVRGDIEKRDSISILFILLTVGIFFLSFLNKYFIIFVFLMLLTNFLHSSNLTRWKENLYTLSGNMLILQFLKFSSGWFLLTSNISHFPFFLILTFTGGYTIIYLFYKNKASWGMNAKERITVGILGSVSLLSYILSFFLYHFQIPLILLLVMGISLYMVERKVEIESHLPKRGGTLMMICFVFVLFSFYSLVNPQIAESNQLINQRMEKYERGIPEKLPEDLVKRLEMINNKTEKYETLEELENVIKRERGKLFNITEEVGETEPINTSSK